MHADKIRLKKYSCLRLAPVNSEKTNNKHNLKAKKLKFVLHYNYRHSIEFCKSHYRQLINIKVMQEITLLGMHWWTALHCCCCCCAFCRLTDRAGRATGLPAALSPPLIVWHWHTMTSNDADDICLSASIWIWICRVSVKGMEVLWGSFHLSVIVSPQSTEGIHTQTHIN